MHARATKLLISYDSTAFSNDDMWLKNGSLKSNISNLQLHMFKVKRPESEGGHNKSNNTYEITRYVRYALSI